jgi:cold shock CspA family protein
MASSQDTFAKREREKQRIKKQQEKLEKMKERKTNKEKPKSLEDMMVYLDENGNLSKTPPDPRKKKVFLQQDMQVSVPKLEDRKPDEPRKGTVAFFNTQKGFGFINVDETGERVFVHANELSSPIQENDKVQFLIGSGPKGLLAIDVKLVK